MWMGTVPARKKNPDIKPFFFGSIFYNFFAFITATLFDAILCSFKLDSASDAQVRFSRSMAADCGNGYEPIIYVEVSFNKLPGVRSIPLFTFLSSSPQATDADRPGRPVAKDMHVHAILLDLLGQVTVFVPQESQVVSVLMPHQESVEHLLDIGSDCDEVLPEPQQHTQEYCSIRGLWAAQGT